MSFSFDRQKFQPAEAQPGDSERLADDGGAWREAPLDLPSGLLEREEEEDDVADCMVAWWVSGGGAQWRQCIEGVLCCQVDGVYLDTPQFRGALARLVRVKNERVAVQAREQPLMRLARRLEAAYLGHRERVLALDGLDIWREWGDGDQRRAYAAIAARLDKAFTPKDAPEGPLDVAADEVEAFVAAYTTDNDPSPAPHQILHLWLTETLVPRYLNPPVFQALARYCMRAQLQEAAQAPL